MRRANVVFTLIAGLILLFQAGTNVALADDGGRKALNQGRDRIDNVPVTASAVKTTLAASQAAGDMQPPPLPSVETKIPLVALGGTFVSLGVWLLRRPMRPIYHLS